MDSDDLADRTFDTFMNDKGVMHKERHKEILEAYQELINIADKGYWKPEYEALVKTWTAFNDQDLIKEANATSNALMKAVRQRLPDAQPAPESYRDKSSRCKIPFCSRNIISHVVKLLFSNIQYLQHRSPS